MKDSMKSHDASRWFISEPDSVDAAIPDGLGGRAMNRSPQVQVTLSDDLLSHLRKTAKSSTFLFAGWLPVWSVTLWNQG